MPEQAINQTITQFVTLEATTCWCGVAFAVETNFLKNKRESKGMIYCPLGHEGWYWQEPEITKLKRELEAKDRQIQYEREHKEEEIRARKRAVASNRSLRGVVTRTKRRVVAGVCPVHGCKRHFTNLQRHIESKHPRYKHQDIG